MKLYVGNATRQIQDFTYRLPEVPGARMQTIPIGAQVRITGDLNQPQIDAIVDQMAKYGMVPVSEIDRTKAFCGLCYSVDRPIAVAKLMAAMERNNQILIARGKQIRQHAAIAQNNQLEQSLEETGSPANLRGFEMSVVEENHDDRDETAPIAEGVRVVRDANTPGPRGNSRRRNAA